MPMPFRGHQKYSFMMFSVLSRTAGGLTGCFMLTRQMTVKAQQQADPALARYS